MTHVGKAYHTSTSPTRAHGMDAALQYIQSIHLGTTAGVPVHTQLYVPLSQRDTALGGNPRGCVLRLGTESLTVG